MNSYTECAYAIPERLNLALLVLASLVSAALLFFASHTQSWLILVVCAIAFSFTANTLFSLLHEAVHGIFSGQRYVNEWGGRFASAWFPTGLSLQRAFHLTHHKNNRSYLEQFDVIHDGDVRWLKYAQWYAIFTGVYWLVTVLGLLVYMFVPSMLRVRLLREDKSKVAEQTSSLAYLAVLDHLNPLGARLEIALSLLLQGLLFWTLDLSIAGWLACYAAFAINWSSLQYTDHAFSPLDPHHGAWNLRVGPIGRAFFLNYHSHLAHHQNPRVPWIHLKSLVIPGSPQPRFFRVWREALRGPRKIDEFPRIADAPLFHQPFLGFPRGMDAWFAAGAAIVFLLLFLLLYGGASELSAFIPWRFEVSLPFESAVPFLPEAAIIYLSLNVLLGLAPFVLRSWRQLFPLFATLVFELFLGAAFFLAFPIHTTFPERYAEGVNGVIFRAADTINLDGNFFPSLHVAFAFSAALAYASKTRVLGRFALYVWATAIAGSTVLIHEHQVLDVVAGLLLALLAWPLVGGWAKTPKVLEAVDIELLCFRNSWLFGKRNRRYWLIALAIISESIPKWRTRRVLRSGFCFLQEVDDLLDGDRPSAREPLEVVDDVVRAIQSGHFGDDGLMRLAKAFVSDIRDIGGDASIKSVLALIGVMSRDRRRVIGGVELSREALRDHHRETFTLSIDLMLAARSAELRATDVPELIDLLGWCSTMRDLREDLEAGLINIPADVLNAARAKGLSSLDFDAVLGAMPVRAWLKEEFAHANKLIVAAEHRLDSVGRRTGVKVLRIFTRSIQKFSRQRFPKLFPSLEFG